jgi:predicted dehydrogenase
MRFATIGSNYITEWFLTAAAQCDGFTLQAVYSRSAEQAEANRVRWGAHTAYADLCALAADPLVDAVYLASPNHCHVAQSQQMLRAGKHVLCEKPIAPDEASLASLLATAREHGVLLLEAMRPAFLPAVEEIRALLPGLGTLRYAEFPYCQYSSRYDHVLAGGRENAFDPTLCNGALMDIGVYCVHWMLILLGEPSDVISRASFMPHAIDVSGTALCSYPGFVAQLCYSKVHASLRPCVLEGEKGSLHIRPFPLPTDATFTPRGGEAQVISLNTPALDMALEINAFMRMAAHPGDAAPYQQLSLQALRVMDRIRLDNGIDFQRRLHTV